MDSIEALWSVSFISNAHLMPGVAPGGGGIVVLENGRVLGGDPWMTYVGEYRCPQGSKRIEATVEVKEYRPGNMSVFGPIKHFNLQLAGDHQSDQFVMQGHMVEHPEQRIAIEFVRRAELP